MNAAITMSMSSLSASDWLQLFLHFTLMSLLSVGGAISTLPDMHRYLVGQQHWLSELQFNASVALAQAAPGHNVLFVALLGWQVGVNAGSLWLGMLGVLLAMLGIILPSATLTMSFATWSYRNKESLIVRSFKQGMAPVVIGLLIATGWIMASAQQAQVMSMMTWGLVIFSAILVWRTRVHLLYLLLLGAVLGWFGLV